MSDLTPSLSMVFKQATSLSTNIFNASKSPTFQFERAQGALSQRECSSGSVRDYKENKLAGQYRQQVENVKGQQQGLQRGVLDNAGKNSIQPVTQSLTEEFKNSLKISKNKNGRVKEQLKTRLNGKCSKRTIELCLKTKLNSQLNPNQLSLNQESLSRRLWTPSKANHQEKSESKYQRSQGLTSKTASIRARKRVKVESAEQVCPICLVQFSKVKGILPCTHQFCLSCINQWIKASTNCPCCRKPFQEIIKHQFGTQQQLIKVEPRQFQLQQDDDDDYVCYVCGRGDNQHILFLCDQCDFYAAHSYCDPRLRNTVPNSHWFCQFCCDRQPHLHDYMSGNLDQSMLDFIAYSNQSEEDDPINTSSQLSQLEQNDGEVSQNLSAIYQSFQLVLNSHDRIVRIRRPVHRRVSQSPTAPPSGVITRRALARSRQLQNQPFSRQRDEEEAPVAARTRFHRSSLRNQLNNADQQVNNGGGRLRRLRNIRRMN